MRSDATVVIVGAGPAGLVLGCVLQAEGIDALIVEHRTYEQCITRARAGFLAANSARILGDHDLAAGMFRDGERHSTCEFRSSAVHFELAYDGLGGGEVHTVYPQQHLVRDLIADFQRLGGDISFETEVVAINDITSDRPSVACRTVGGEHRTVHGRYIAGCDGQHGVARRSLPAGTFTRWDRDHGISWLALLAEAPPSMGAVVYAIHERGFAGHMARTSTITRYYLQCQPAMDPYDWTDEQVWGELHDRMQADEFGALKEGPILERAVVAMSSTVIDPIQCGRLFLAGDAASLISPSAAKGANLAIMEAEVLARALSEAITKGDHRFLRRYSADCLPRIWRAQEFSHWMINLLHGPAGDDDDARFLRALQLARLQNLKSSRTLQDYFAENYVGI